ncbi:eukaryotic translation initiation factor 2-alpha kinase [Sorochytrium milnesiophthora]
MDANKEVQDNEVEAIKAIYTNDFRLIEQHNPWRKLKNAPQFSVDFPHFVLHIRPAQGSAATLSTDATQVQLMEDLLQRSVSVDLVVRFNHKYPNDVPDLSLADARGLSADQVAALLSLLKELALQLVGQEMVFDLAVFAQDWIGTHNTVPGNLIPPTRAMAERQSSYQQMQLRTQEDEARREAQLREQAERDAALAREHEQEQSQYWQKEFEEERHRKEKLIRQEKFKRKQESSSLLHLALTSSSPHSPSALPVAQQDAFSPSKLRVGAAIYLGKVVVLSPDEPDSAAFHTIILGPRLSDHTFLAFPSGLVDPKTASLSPSIPGVPTPSITSAQDISLVVRVLELGYQVCQECAVHKVSQQDNPLKPPLLLDLEREIDKATVRRLSSAHHPHCVETYEFVTFVVPRSPSDTHPPSDPRLLSYVAYILVIEECTYGGSLADMLQKCRRMSIAVACDYLRQLLQALVHIHRYTNHRDVRSQNVLFVSPDSNTVKLTGTSYLGRMRDLLRSAVGASRPPCVSASTTSSHPGDHVLIDPASPVFSMLGTEAASWTAPELLHKATSSAAAMHQYTRKSDIWYLGVVFATLLGGADMMDKARSPKDLLSDKDKDSPLSHVPPQVMSLLRNMLDTDPRKRSGAHDLLSKGVLQSALPSDLPRELAVFDTLSLAALDMPSAAHTNLHNLQVSTAPRAVPSALALPDDTGLRVITSPGGTQSHVPNPLTTPATGAAAITSRYRQDFDELEFLGRGGFGEVVKARNKLDGRMYAIKHIKLDPEKLESNRKILREVRTLSRLNSARCVRYYQAWLEDTKGVWAHFNDNSYDSSDGSEEDDSYTSWSSESESEDDDDDDCKEADATGPRGRGKRQDVLARDLSDLTSSDWLVSEKSHSATFIQFSRTAGRSASPPSTSSPDISFEVDEADVKTGQPLCAASDVSSSPSSSPSPGPSPHRSTRGRRRSVSTTRRASAGPRRKRDGAEVEFKVLYIQMEYCEKKTLRDVIDEGVMAEPETWRILRQIVEGLVHIHAQGMIHRDLKPKNIFMDANDNVKIGDFDIGTALYTAPEVVNPAVTKYNQKIDIYSLGIIFFETIFPFGTGMERAVALRDLRREEIVFPAEFDAVKYATQSKIIRWLLNHDPRQRPTSQQLLQCDDIPTQMEDEYVQEALRAIVNPQAAHYNKLMTTLFSQPINRHKDYTYDFNTAGHAFEPVATVLFAKLRDYLTAVFRRHGAVDFSAPLLMPKHSVYDYTSKRPVTLLDSTGGLVQVLPYDLTVPFARYVARNGITHMKRYAFSHVYRESVGGGQPRTVLEVDLDIVHPSKAEMVLEADVLKILADCLACFPPVLKQDYHFRVNHGSLIQVIAEHCRISVDKLLAAAPIIDQWNRAYTWPQVKSLLMGQCQLAKPAVESLERFAFECTIDQLADRLNDISPALPAKSARLVQSLRRLKGYLENLGVMAPVIIAPLLMYNLSYYQNGLIFQAVLDNRSTKKKLDILASGGRYDHLIRQFLLPTMSKVTPYAVGVHIAAQKLITIVSETLMERRSEEMLAKWEPRKFDVLVASYGSGLLAERMKLANELWAAGVRCDFVYDDGNYTAESLAHLCKVHGIEWIAFAKHCAPSTATREMVKVRNVRTKTETEHARPEVGRWLLNELDMGSSMSSHAAALPTLAPALHSEGATSSHADVANQRVSVVSHSMYSLRKQKHKQKAIMIDKASVKASSLTETLRHAEVLVVQLPDDILQQLVCVNVMLDDSFKKVLEAVRAADREYVQSVRKAMMRLREDGQRICMLYSSTNDTCHIYQFR